MSYRVSQEQEYKGGDTWKWSVWIEGSEPELDAVDYVQYTLHPTFSNPVRKIDDRASKFKLKSGGWGTFTILVSIYLKEGKKLNLEHELELYYPTSPTD